MAPPRRNVELKARDPDPARSLERCVALGAEDRGELRQRDTYFAARRGRLKLREQEPGGAELIAYERADAAEARESRYRIAPVAEPGPLRGALDAALRTAVGAVHAAANVENAAYPQGQCAEASAIGAMVAAGGTEIAAVAVTAERLEICPPCGGCRQRPAELARPETPVHLGRPGGRRPTVTLRG